MTNVSKMCPTFSARSAIMCPYCTVVVLSRLLLMGNPSLLRTITPITLGVSWIVCR